MEVLSFADLYVILTDWKYFNSGMGEGLGKFFYLLLVLWLTDADHTSNQCRREI